MVNDNDKMNSVIAFLIPLYCYASLRATLFY